MTVKRLEILKETIPNLARVAILLNPANSAAKPILDALRTAAKSLKVELQPVEARTPAEIDIALSAKSIGQAKALVVQSDTLFFANTAKIADLSARRHLPSAGNGPIAEAGGLIGYGPGFGGGFYRAAALVDKILKGAKPADMPIEQPTKFELVVNLKTAKALGLKIPQSVLLRADRVIE